MSKARSLRGKKFHFVGRGERGYVLSECTPEEEGLTITVDAPRYGEPLKAGEELCHIRDRGDGHYDFAELSDGDGGGGDGPPMVASESYRSGWDATFGHGSKSRSN